MSASQSLANVTNINDLSTDRNTFNVLKETLYPGATDQEVMMVLSYCKARKIDPMLKPIHLVPMNVKTDKKDKDGKFIYETKRVIMPGISLYRIDASRSGQYAGMSEPVFGEDITEEFPVKDKGTIKVTYPKWCKVTVKKILANGAIAEFTAKEYWKENYATKSRWDTAPNEMWDKRAYGQLAKCTEAQVLRKAFPDVVGNEYTKEEMEGKHHLDNHSETKKIHAKSKNTIIEEEKVEPEIHSIEKDLMDISWCENITYLLEVYTKVYKFWANAKNKENLEKVMVAKDKRKAELESIETVNAETGEIK